MNNAIRLLIVDDDAPFRQATRTLLEDSDGVTVVGEAKDGPEAIELARKLQPDVILLDVNMLRMNSSQTAVRINELYRNSKVIILGANGQEHLVLDALRKGAWGFLVKGKGKPAEIVEAIRAVAREEVILSPWIAGRILDEITR